MLFDTKQNYVVILSARRNVLQKWEDAQDQCTHAHSRVFVALPIKIDVAFSRVVLDCCTFCCISPLPEKCYSSICNRNGVESLQ